MRGSSFLAAASALTLATAQDLTTALSGVASLSTLADLLSQFPEIADFIASQEDVTLFAPNNAALAAILEGGGIFSLDQASADPSLIEQILRYHLVRGAISSDQITAIPQFVSTYLNYSGIVLDQEVSGSNVTGGQVVSVAVDEEGNVGVTSGIKSVSNVVAAVSFSSSTLHAWRQSLQLTHQAQDIEYDNGIVHVIDALLTIPLSVSETLLTANLTGLAAAATIANLVDPLEAATDITIFAPNNDAFQAISSQASTLSLAALAELLQYHVVPGTVAYSTTLANTTLPTLQGSTLTLTLSPDGAVFANSARVINTDILIENGVLHVIDQVLNTGDEPGQQASDAGFVPFTSALPPLTTTYQELADLEATTSFVAAALVSATPTSSGVGNATASMSVPVQQQTGNAGVRNELPALAAAVLGAVAFAVDL